MQASWLLAATHIHVERDMDTMKLCPEVCQRINMLWWPWPDWASAYPKPTEQAKILGVVNYKIPLDPNMVSGGLRPEWVSVCVAVSGVEEPTVKEPTPPPSPQKAPPRAAAESQPVTLPRAAFNPAPVSRARPEGFGRAGDMDRPNRGPAAPEPRARDRPRGGAGPGRGDAYGGGHREGGAARYIPD
jgi:hypothetical protein